MKRTLTILVMTGILASIPARTDEQELKEELKRQSVEAIMLFSATAQLYERSSPETRPEKIPGVCFWAGAAIESDRILDLINQNNGVLKRAADRARVFSDENCNI